MMKASYERTRRAAAIIAATVAALVLHPGDAGAAGGEYVVAQCHSINRGHQATLSDGRAYAVGNWCGDSSQDNALKIQSLGDTGAGRGGQIRWSVPAPLALVGADLQARLRNDGGHHANVFSADTAGRELRRIGKGEAEPSRFRHLRTRFSAAASVIAQLRCDASGGCPSSEQAKTWVREAKLTIADYSDPSFVRLEGSLRDPGWRRGTHGLEAVGLDQGAGLERIRATVNGAQLGVSPGQCPGKIPGSALASRLIPCLFSGELRLSADTLDPPFRNGVNSLSVCAIDFAANRRCEQRTIRVDNAPPVLAFANAQDPSDPEVIRAVAFDPHSGVTSGGISMRAEGSPSWQPLSTRLTEGELRTRVDSASYAPGRYQFKVEAGDVAGNRAGTDKRVNGQTMTLNFPLRERVRLSSHIAPSGSRRQTIAYGRDSRVVGRLVDAAGEPLRRQQVRVEEYFGAGALIDRRVREVRTDVRGRFRSKLPAGPSRQVTAIYAGTPRYLEERSGAGRLAVKSRASFRISRRKVGAGGAVLFSGRVAHFGARIPSGGKLVELQVREAPGRWNTVREAFRSNDRGRYRLRYRFGNFYERDARFRFRVKVAREQRWPYKAPVRSRARTVTVKAR